MSYYYNTAGQRFDLPERPLEPPEARGPLSNVRHPKKLTAGMKKTAASATDADSGKQTTHTR